MGRKLDDSARRAPRLYDVTVVGYGASIEIATSAGQAREQVRCNDIFRGITPQAFLAISTARLRREPAPETGYDYVRRTYGVDPRIGQRMRTPDGRIGTVAYPGTSTSRVHAILDGRTHATPFHPMEIELIPPGLDPDAGRRAA